MMSSLKGMGRNVLWSRYGTGGGYEDAIQVGKYKVEIEDNDDDMRIFIWNPKEPCINMVLDKRDYVGVLDAIKYNPDCTTPEQMKRGKDTRDMVDFAIDFLQKNGAKSVSLSDKSTIQCGKEEVHLGQMYFLKYGMTWYEKYFGFKPATKFKKRYEEMKQRRIDILNIEFLSKQSCDFFDIDTIRDIFEHIRFVDFFLIEWIKQL